MTAEDRRLTGCQTSPGGKCKKCYCFARILQYNASHLWKGKKPMQGRDTSKKLLSCVMTFRF